MKNFVKTLFIIVFVEFAQTAYSPTSENSRNFLDTATFKTTPLPDDQTLQNIDNYEVEMPKRFDFNAWEVEYNKSLKSSVEIFINSTTKNFRKALWINSFTFEEDFM
jgi:hypothetical protein